MHVASRMKIQEGSQAQASKTGEEVSMQCCHSGLGCVHAVKSQRHPRVDTECWGLQDKVQTGSVIEY